MSSTPTSTKPAGDSPQPGPTGGQFEDTGAKAGAPDKAPVVVSDATPSPEAGADATPKVETAVPEKYELKLPENAVLDATSLERIAATARERGLSNEQAQSLVDLANSEAVSVREAALAAHQPGGAEWVKQESQWRTAAEKDPEIGGTPEKLQASLGIANRVLTQYFPPEIKDFLETSGLGSNPSIIKGLVKIGRASSETPTIHPDGTGGGSKKLEELLYPTMAG